MEQEEFQIYVNRQDKKIGKIFCDYILLLLSYNLFRRIFQLGKTGCFFFLAILLMIFLFKNLDGIIKIIKKRARLIVLCETGFFLLYSLSYLRGDLEVSVFMKYFAYTGVLCTPMLAAGTMLYDKEILYKELKKASVIMILLGTFIFLAGRQDGDTYNMQYSYCMLLPALVFINEYLRNKKIIYFWAAFYVVLLILVFGSRGPLVCLALFFVMRLYASDGNRVLKVLFTIILGSTVILWKNICTIVLSFFNAFGIQSRSLNLLFGGKLFYLSGRGEIWRKTMELIKENWILGCGVATDIKKLGEYPHNIFLEILYDYGIFWGTAAIILLLYLFVEILKEDKTGTAWVLISFCFFSLLFSGTYLRESGLFFLIGICIGGIHRKKQ